MSTTNPTPAPERRKTEPQHRGYVAGRKATADYLESLRRARERSAIENDERRQDVARWCDDMRSVGLWDGE